MKKETFEKATKKIKKKPQAEIKVSDELKELVLSTLKRNDIKVVADKAIGDSSDEGEYYIVDSNGRVLFQLLINPYTIRLLKDGKLVGETHVVPVRNGMDDDVIIQDENMLEIVKEVDALYSVYHTEYKGVTKQAKPSRGR